MCCCCCWCIISQLSGAEPSLSSSSSTVWLWFAAFIYLHVSQTSIRFRSVPFRSHTAAAVHNGGEGYRRRRRCSRLLADHQPTATFKINHDRSTLEIRRRRLRWRQPHRIPLVLVLGGGGGGGGGHGKDISDKRGKQNNQLHHQQRLLLLLLMDGRMDTNGHLQEGEEEDCAGQQRFNHS